MFRLATAVSTCPPFEHQKLSISVPLGSFISVLSTFIPGVDVSTSLQEMRESHLGPAVTLYPFILWSEVRAQV
jgi:hypothetical protein